MGGDGWWGGYVKVFCRVRLGKLVLYLRMEWLRMGEVFGCMDVVGIYGNIYIYGKLDMIW